MKLVTANHVRPAPTAKPVESVLPVRRGPEAPHRRGFSLIETLFALGVFVIGFVMIAAMFPAAIMLQKQTVDDVTTQIVARNAQAIMDSAKLDSTILDPAAVVPHDTKLHALLPILEAQFPNHPALNVENRSYPSDDPDINNRPYYWVPMIRRREVKSAAPFTSPGQWEVVVFVLKNRNLTEYDKASGGGQAPTGVWNIVAGESNFFPSVKKITGVTTPSTRRFDFNNDDNQGATDQDPDLRIGDQFADEYGTIHTVTQSDTGGVTVGGVIFPAGSNPPGQNPAEVPNYGQMPVEIWIGAAPNFGGKSSVARMFPLFDVVE